MPAVSQLMPWNESRSAELQGNGDGSAGGPVSAAIERESARAVREAILMLPEHFRVPLVLKEMLELSIEDVAQALNLKPDTVKTRVHRARLLLRKAILARPRLPKRAASLPSYDRQVCLDLLRAKLDAMDRGAGFPISQEVVCERCRAVFAELDLAQNTCASWADRAMPEHVHKAVLRAIRQADASAQAAAQV